MKQFTKVILIVGACLCGAGILLGVSAYAAAGFDYTNFILERDRMNVKSISMPINDLKDITILTKNRKINVILTEEEDVAIHCCGTDAQLSYATFSETKDADGGRALKLEYLPKETIHLFGLSPFLQDDSIELRLPKAYRENLTLTTSNASIRTETLTLEGALSLTTSNSSINVKNLSASQIALTTTNGSIDADGLTTEGTLTLKSTNGRLKLTQAAAADIRLNTSNAAVTVKDSHAQGSIEAASSSGRMEGDNLQSSTLSMSTTNGKIELERVSVSDSLKAVTTNGGVSVEQIRSSDILLKSTNGTVKGTIAGKYSDYNVQSHTTNGKNNLTNQINQGTTNQINVQTTNGRIDISFTE